MLALLQERSIEALVLDTPFVEYVASTRCEAFVVVRPSCGPCAVARHTVTLPRFCRRGLAARHRFWLTLTPSQLLGCGAVRQAGGPPRVGVSQVRPPSSRAAPQVGRSFWRVDTAFAYSRRMPRALAYDLDRWGGGLGLGHRGGMGWPGEWRWGEGHLADRQAGTPRGGGASLGAASPAAWGLARRWISPPRHHCAPPPPRVTTLADDRSYVVERTYQRYVKATKGGAHCLRASSDHEEQQLGKIGVAQVHGDLGAGGGGLGTARSQRATQRAPERRRMKGARNGCLRLSHAGPLACSVSC
jgi:hypothetical protein